MMIHVTPYRSTWKSYCKHVKNKSKKKEIIVLCGSSHCRKTYYRKPLENLYTVINTDTIRLRLTKDTHLNSKKEPRVWEIFEDLKQISIKHGENIILDACHITPQARWHALRVPCDYKKICVLFHSKLKTIKSRCKEKWAVDMWRAFKRNKPTKAELLLEGFDEVREIREEVITNG